MILYCLSYADNSWKWRGSQTISNSKAPQRQQHSNEGTWKARAGGNLNFHKVVEDVLSNHFYPSVLVTAPSWQAARKPASKIVFCADICKIHKPNRKEIVLVSGKQHVLGSLGSFPLCCSDVIGSRNDWETIHTWSDAVEGDPLPRLPLQPFRPTEHKHTNNCPR